MDFDFRASAIYAAQHLSAVQAACLHSDNYMAFYDSDGEDDARWLLGYPVVYLFSKEHIDDAIYNLSSKYLHIFQLSICRNSILKKGSQAEELLSFSMPYDLSARGNNEEWVESFMAHMSAKWERCAYAWKFLKMEVDECHPQAIVL